MARFVRPRLHVDAESSMRDRLDECAGRGGGAFGAFKPMIRLVTPLTVD